MEDYISSEDRLNDSSTLFQLSLNAQYCSCHHVKNEDCPERIKQMFNTDEENKASKIPNLIYKTDKTSHIVDEKNWGDGNPCYAVYYIPKKNIHVKLEGLYDKHGSPREQWHRSFICKEIVKEEFSYEEVEVEVDGTTKHNSPKTKQQIIEMVQNGYQSDLDLLGDEYDWGKAFYTNGIDQADDSFVKLVDEGRDATDYEGEYNLFRLFHVIPHDIYVKIEGRYSSYDDTKWSSIKLVRKVSHQRKVYV